MAERIDPDYDPSERQVEDALKLLAAAATVRIPFFHYKNGNGANGFQKWILGIVAVLIAAGVVADMRLQYVNGERLAVLETKVDVLLRK